MLFVAVILCAAATAAAADPALQVSVDASGEVIFCQAELAGEREGIAQALKEGTQVTLTWQFTVSQPRSYWLDAGIAEVQVVHRAVPDLVSGNWRLLDLSSGIERRVPNVDDAVRFLTRLERFPVLDRSLLQKGVPYRMQVSVEEQQGEEKAGWFSHWWGYAEIEGAVEFRLR